MTERENLTSFRATQNCFEGRHVPGVEDPKRCYHCGSSALGRYELRGYAIKSSKKKFHVWDRKANREVFHTDNRERAEAVIALAGDGDITQHLKDRGHHYEASHGDGRMVDPCKRCSR